jgi:large subunit ribosomal protein L22
VVEVIKQVKDIKSALEILKFMPQKPARIVAEVIKSAWENAKNMPEMEEENLYLKKIFINQGPILKPLRWRPTFRGRATRIRKRTAHITVIISDEK